jgi:hypothetical protein
MIRALIVWVILSFALAPKIGRWIRRNDDSVPPA